MCFYRTSHWILLSESQVNQMRREDEIGFKSCQNTKYLPNVPNQKYNFVKSVFSVFCNLFPDTHFVFWAEIYVKLEGLYITRFVTGDNTRRVKAGLT